MTLQSNFDVLVVGGNADGLTLAASLTEMGKKTALLESNMKIGGELLTESFLTSHRYNLSGGWQLAESLAQIDVPEFDENNKLLLFPEIPMAFLFDNQEPLIFHRSLAELQSQIVRADRKKWLRFLDVSESLYASVYGYFSGTGKVELSRITGLSGKTVKQVLDTFEFTDQRLRCALTYLPLALGYDINMPGSGAALAFLLHGLSKLSVVDGGSGLLVNSLADRMTARGGMIFESTRIKEINNKKGRHKSILLEDGRVFTAPVIVFAKSDAVVEQRNKDARSVNKTETELGVYRIYLDFKRSPAGFNTAMGGDEILKQAYMISFGFNREEDIYHYLKMVKVGQPPFIAGHVISNSFLDVNSPVGALGVQHEDLWCTACHTSNTRQLSQQAGLPANAQKNASVQAKIALMRQFSTADKTMPGQLEASRDQMFGRNSDTHDSGFSMRPLPGSLIWQGVFPQQTRILDVEGFRKSFERACVEKIVKTVKGIEQEDLRFQLTWLGNETREPLVQLDLIEMLSNKDLEKRYITEDEGIFVNTYASLSRFTGMRSGQKLVSTLTNKLV